jgi:predicted transcriptional regulator
MIEKVSAALYIADASEAALMFPNLKGEVDMSTMFVGRDPAFCEWCADLFDHMWAKSKPLNVKKLKVVEY